MQRRPCDAWRFATRVILFPVEPTTFSFISSPLTVPSYVIVPRSIVISKAILSPSGLPLSILPSYSARWTLPASAAPGSTVMVVSTGPIWVSMVSFQTPSAMKRGAIFVSRRAPVPPVALGCRPGGSPVAQGV